MLKAMLVLAASVFAVTASAGKADDAPSVLYSHTASVALPGGAPDWDYLRLDQATGRLFIARHDDGLTVFDINGQRKIGDVANGIGSNGPLVVPGYGRGYAAMTDGTALVFDLKTLAAIGKVRLDPE